MTAHSVSNPYLTAAGIAANYGSQYIPAASGNLNASQQQRQSNINILNTFQANVARDKTFDPTRAFQEMRRGQALASYLQTGGSAMPTAYGQAPGAARANSATGNSDIQAGIIQSLLNTGKGNIYSINDGVFDPSALAPDLAFGVGQAKKGKYQVGGEIRSFGDAGRGASGSDVGSTVQGAGGGASAGASAGATIGMAGGPIGAGAGAAIGAGVGAYMGYRKGKALNKEAEENRRANIDILNQRANEVANAQAFDPLASYRSLLSGQALVSSAQTGGSALTGYGEAPGAARANSATGFSEADRIMIEALRNPAAFSMIAGPDGGFKFDPLRINPLDLNFLSGNSKNGGYQKNGETKFFGKNPNARKGSSASSNVSLGEGERDG